MAEPNATPIRVIEETPGYWRAVFDYPPFNVVDGDVFQALQDLLVRMETSETLRVVVFESALPDFYLSHFDLTGKLGNVMTGIGPSGLPILMDTFVRLTKVPVVSLAKIRGCVRGVSSEFVLACDMRFASRENLKLGHPELGVGLHPGGGGTERLPHLVGRGRALESSSALTTLMETRQNDMAMSTVHCRTPNWTVSSMLLRAGSAPSTDRLSPRPNISLTKSRCPQPTGFSPPSHHLGRHSAGLRPRTA
jgi:enoyl-CoA hydratase/carnithine racemase